MLRVGVRLRKLAVADLLETLWTAAAEKQVRTLADRATRHAALGNVHSVAHLLSALRTVKADDQAAALASRAAAHVSLEHLPGIAYLLDQLRAASADEQIGVLIARNLAARASPVSPAARGSDSSTCR
jgi:hypothetical protein